jgi:hypothetical protein
VNVLRRQKPRNLLIQEVTINKVAREVAVIVIITVIAITITIVTTMAITTRLNNITDMMVMTTITMASLIPSTIITRLLLMDITPIRIRLMAIMYYHRLTATDARTTTIGAHRLPLVRHTTQ